MKRRDSEKQNHPFKLRFSKICNMHDLQGLLISGNSTFTAAVEAFTIGRDEKINSIKNEAFPIDEFYAKVIFAENLGVPFYVFTHRDGSNIITMFNVISDRETRDVKSKYNNTGNKMSEDEFVNWWRVHKGTLQTKPYRHQLINRVSDSYYDNLLETNNLKWGGNIDSFLSVCSNNQDTILAVVENRFTNKKSIKRYDPNEYFTCGGGDYYTWLPLFMIKEQLNVPIFLCTYSNIVGEENLLGISQVVELNSDCIKYKFDIKPYQNLFDDIINAKDWLFKEIENYE